MKFLHPLLGTCCPHTESQRGDRNGCKGESTDYTRRQTPATSRTPCNSDSLDVRAGMVNLGDDGDRDDGADDGFGTLP